MSILKAVVSVVLMIPIVFVFCFVIPVYLAIDFPNSVLGFSLAVLSAIAAIIIIIFGVLVINEE